MIYWGTTLVLWFFIRERAHGSPKHACHQVWTYAPVSRFSFVIQLLYFSHEKFYVALSEYQAIFWLYLAA